MNIFIIIFSLLLLTSLVFVIIRYFLKRTSLDYIDKFSTYTAVLQFHMEKSYDIIHKDRILIFSLEAVKPKDEDILSAAKDFAKLVLKFIGPRLENDLIYLYGDKETLMFNLIEYFNSKFEGDEIRQTAINKISNQENSVSAETTLNSLLKK